MVSRLCSAGRLSMVNKFFILFFTQQNSNCHSFSTAIMFEVQSGRKVGGSKVIFHPSLGAAWSKTELLLSKSSSDKSHVKCFPLNFLPVQNVWSESHTPTKVAPLETFEILNPRMARKLLGLFKGLFDRPHVSFCGAIFPCLTELHAFLNSKVPCHRCSKFFFVNIF